MPTPLLFMDQLVSNLADATFVSVLSDCAESAGNPIGSALVSEIKGRKLFTIWNVNLPRGD